MGKDTLKISKSGLNTVVGKSSVLEGNFEIAEGVRVDGSLKGRLVSSGLLVVCPSAVVRADPIRVENAIIAGRVVDQVGDPKRPFGSNLRAFSPLRVTFSRTSFPS